MNTYESQALLPAIVLTDGEKDIAVVRSQGVGEVFRARTDVVVLFTQKLVSYLQI